MMSYEALCNGALEEQVAPPLPAIPLAAREVTPS
jgi:hypothetical protein